MVFDVKTGKQMALGKCNEGIVSLEWIQELNLLVSFSLDKSVRFWSLNNKNKKPSARFDLDWPIYTADVKFPMCGIGMANQKTTLFNIKELSNIKNFDCFFNYFDTPLES